MEIIDSSKLDSMLIRVISRTIDDVETLICLINTINEDRCNFDVVAENISRYKKEELDIAYPQLPETKNLFLKCM